MEIKVDGFYKEYNLKNEEFEKECPNINTHIAICEAISKGTYQSIYLVDYYKKSFLYVSENSLLLCGHTANEVKNMGFDFYIHHVPEEDLEMLLDINEAGFKFYNNIPISDRLDYTISYDFRIIGLDHKPILINHKLIPLVLNKMNQLWIAVCIVSLSQNSTTGNIEIIKENGEEVYEYNRSLKTWFSKIPVKLKNREKEILFLCAQGYKSERIASILHISLDTIKFHKRNIYERLGVTNTIEAISYCMKYKLF